ncbi:MAG: amidohydrolase family protein, partial [Bryobacteraceae bacterium]
APTLAVYEPRRTTLEAVQPGVLRVRSVVAPEARERRWKILMGNVATLRAAGIPFGVGTDAGVSGTYHGRATWRELELLVEGGLTPMEAITAATAVAARALKVDRERGTIEAGKLADLVLVEGAPHRDIADIRKVARVFLGGREIDRTALAREMAATGPTPLPARKAGSLIDDMERGDGRTSLGTLRGNATDSGHEHSRMLMARTASGAGDHALSVLARMSETDRPFVRVVFPLSPGAFEPVDARGFTSVRLAVRGEGAYRLVVDTRRGPATAEFQAGTEWRTVDAPFDKLVFAAGWTGDDLVSVGVEIARPAGETAWLELDNLRFHRRIP